jgi:hypothetical protein
MASSAVQPTPIAVDEGAITPARAALPITAIIVIAVVPASFWCAVLWLIFWQLGAPLSRFALLCIWAGIAGFLGFVVAAIRTGK